VVELGVKALYSMLSHPLGFFIFNFYFFNF
jgi:hypothetical protein